MVRTYSWAVTTDDYRADQVIALVAGRVAQRGRASELADADGSFRHLRKCAQELFDGVTGGDGM